MIDLTRLNTLRQEIGNEDLREIVDFFLADIQTCLDELTPDSPVQTWAAQLHFLKGCALNLGFSGFCDTCATYEGEVGQSADRSEQIATLARQFLAARKALLAHV